MGFAAIIFIVIAFLVVNTLKKKLSEGTVTTDQLPFWEDSDSESASHGSDPTEKPIIPHSTSDCTGGSIHDGYHEGTAARPQKNTAGPSVAERAGKSRLDLKPLEKNLPKKPAPVVAHPVVSQENKPAQSNTAPASGIDLLTEKLSNEPQIVQGIIWSEILGKPKGDY